MKRIGKYLMLPFIFMGLLLVFNSCDLIDEDILDDPGNLTDYRGNVGETFKFKVTGTDSGTVWGGANGIYTDDSRLGKAAVHAGKVDTGKEVIVTVKILEGQSSYTGNTQNGISTLDYGSWPGSYEFK